jgi:hypothetical protein
LAVGDLSQFRLASGGQDVHAAWVSAESDSNRMMRWTGASGSLNGESWKAAVSQVETPLPISSLALSGGFAGWVESLEEGQVIRLAGAEGGAESVHFIQEGLIDFLDVESRAGTPVAAWSQQSGSTSQVWYAVRLAPGVWESKPVAAGPSSYDLMPTLSMAGDRLECLWYRIDGSDITAWQQPILGTGVGEGSLLDQATLPAFRLPTLFRAAGDDRIGALWVEPLQRGDTTFCIDPRSPDYPLPTLVGSEDATTAVALSDDSYAAKAILDTTPGQPGQLLAENPHWDLVSLTVPGSASNPAIAVAEDSLWLGWVDEDLSLGTKTLWLYEAK